MTVNRYKFIVSFGHSFRINGASMLSDKDGDYVMFKDYQHLSDYCDHLVEFSKLPCLPKDLEVLRDANASFAEENDSLRNQIALMLQTIEELKKTNARIQQELDDADSIIFRKVWL